MSYVLTDDDYANLYGVKQQLGLLAALLGTARQVACDSEQLESTFYALKEPIEKVLDILDAREEIARKSDAMRSFDWMRIITLVSGRDSMSVADIVKMDDKLARAVTADPDMLSVFNAWRNVMTDDGQNPMMQNRNDMGGFQIKFERPVQPAIPPATEQSILSMYGAKDAKDLVKRLVAMGNGANPEELMKNKKKALSMGCKC